MTQYTNYYNNVCYHVRLPHASLQLSEYQQSLSETQFQLSQMRSQLTSIEQSKAQLQLVLNETRGEEKRKESQIKLLEIELSGRTELLANAEDKIQVQEHIKSVTGMLDI